MNKSYKGLDSPRQQEAVSGPFCPRPGIQNCWQIGISELDSSPNCAPYGLQIVLCAPVYTIDNIRYPGL
jgi:hypothetical protein